MMRERIREEWKRKKIEVVRYRHKLVEQTGVIFKSTRRQTDKGVKQQKNRIEIYIYIYIYIYSNSCVCLYKEKGSK
jgi:hypothetical protein